MDELFGRQEAVFLRTFTAEVALVTFEGDSRRPLLSQELQFVYEQNILRIYEVGTQYQYIVAGRAHGAASCGRVVGPRPVVHEFFSLYANAAGDTGKPVTFSL